MLPRWIEKVAILKTLLDYWMYRSNFVLVLFFIPNGLIQSTSGTGDEIQLNEKYQVEKHTFRFNLNVFISRDVNNPAKQTWARPGTALQTPS